MLAHVLLQLGRKEEANAASLKGAESGQNEPKYQHARGIVLYHMSKYKEAEEALLLSRELFMEQNDFAREILEADEILIHLYMETGRMEEVDAVAQRYLERSLPDEPLTLAVEGMGYEHKKYVFKRPLMAEFELNGGEIFCSERRFDLYGVGESLTGALADLFKAFSQLYQGYVETDELLAPSGVKLAKKSRNFVAA